jgi:glycosyltransferase involved in cell wall biosynthesis
MNIYNRRIAFCISDQHLIPYGGIGQFAKSFVETCSVIGIKIDIILDKPASNKDFSAYLQSRGANIIVPKEPLSYSKHAKTFMFEDSYNFEKMINFRECFMSALNDNLYDVVICNTVESFPAIYSLSIQDSVQIVYYTHHENLVFMDENTQKSKFSNSFNEFFIKLMDVKGIYIGTQTRRNVAEIKLSGKDAYYTPIQMTEKDLLSPHTKPREGVLWIGRWEPRKNPEEFVRMIAETKLPAKIITNDTGAKKFEAALKEINAKFEIRSEIYGQEKVDFITSARVAYNPAIRESFGLAFYECIGHMPTVALKGMSWLENFNGTDFFSVDKKDVSSTILKLYEQYKSPFDWYNTGALERVVNMDLSGIAEWFNLFDLFKPTQSNSSKAKINEYETTQYKKYINDLNRKDLSIDDIRSVLTNKHKYNIIYTDNHTYLSKDKNFVPDEQNSSSTLESLFK